MISEFPLDLIPTLSQIVGQANVAMDDASCEKLARTTLPSGTRPVGVVRPASRQQVQEVLRVALQYRIPVYPISCGKNWGYGDACAPRDKMLILDLSRMNRILAVNPTLAYAVIEPGVTQGQLSGYLDQERLPLLLDGNGAGPDASFIGNILERGIGHSRYGDRFSHCCNFEAVLADGSVVVSGFGAYPGAQAQHVYKHGVGPSLDGLLTQSNFAVITRLTIWLQPKPECMNVFFITLKDPKAVGPLFERLRRLFLAGTLRTTLHCFSERRLVASEIRFPWDRADGKEALEISHPSLLQEICKRSGIPAWAASGSLSGSPLEVKAARKALSGALQSMPGLGQLVFFSERRLRWIQTAAGAIEHFSRFHTLRKLLSKIGLGADLMKGIPTYESLMGSHWRARGQADARQDPLDSGAGLIWVSPVLPMEQNALQQALGLSEPVFHEFGFEFQATVSCLNERTLCAVLSICFDHQSEEEVARARQCEEKLLRHLLDQGFIPYRASPRQQEIIRNFSPAIWEALGRLKKAWDPEGILAPGRYLPPV